jgi:hypothetical protein
MHRAMSTDASRHVQRMGVMGVYFASDDEYKRNVFYLQLVKMAEIFLSASEERQVKLDLQVRNNRVEVSRAK